MTQIKVIYRQKKKKRSITAKNEILTQSQSSNFTNSQSNHSSQYKKNKRLLWAHQAENEIWKKRQVHPEVEPQTC